jgi:hypothetical protein
LLVMGNVTTVLRPIPSPFWGLAQAFQLVEAGNALYS